MQIDSSAWQAFQATLQTIKQNQIPRFSEGDIWWGTLGINIGDEENGKGELFERPVLIIRKFSPRMFIGIPLTTSIKRGIFYTPISSGGRQATALL